MPIAVKDLIDVAGTITRCGSPLREHAPPAVMDALAVAMLRRAGTRLVGKTALVEFAFGASGLNDWEGTPPNPHDPARIPGGSSSGSAVAVAEGSAAAALGTDTGGSVRIPAALCGVVGMKPSHAAIPTNGVFPLAPSLDHVGILAPDVASVRDVLAALVPSLGSGRQITRIAVDARALEESSPEVARAIDDALRRWRIERRDVTLVPPDDVMRVSTTIMFSEAALTHRAAFASHRDEYSEGVRERIKRGLATKAVDYLAAREEARAMAARVDELLRDVDALVGPTVGFVAPTIEEARRAPALSARLVRYTRLGNVVGLPAISVPVPTGGMPIGLQLMTLRDADALSAAAALEAALR
ncbi:MAG: hypothetical protein AUH85_08890 [Chloroflexi bacterium 13_1_40CM_4_68_4]|nr:MAG: hypothetical protein AUH85_08890 [Chloroflexi bacterium 13_1_40CM_4_68_4]